MSIKGENKVIQDVYNALESYFAGKISGSLYPKDCRPLNSKLEDAIISGVNSTADQIQEGTIKLNVYVPDIDNGTKRNVPNISRLQAIEDLSESIISTLCSSSAEYKFYQGMSPASINDPEVNQHFINFDIKFNRITF